MFESLEEEREGFWKKKKRILEREDFVGLFLSVIQDLHNLEKPKSYIGGEFWTGRFW